MNANLVKATHDIEKVKGVLFSIENLYLDFDISPEEREKAEHAVNTFYALVDLVHQVEADIENLKGDEKVVDAILAADRVRTLKRE